MLVVFAPEAILDTLVRLDNISRLILGAVIESHLRVTASPHEYGSRKLSGMVWIVNSRRSEAAGSAYVHARMSNSELSRLVCLVRRVCACSLMYHNAKCKLMMVEDTRIQWSVWSCQFRV